MDIYRQDGLYSIPIREPIICGVYLMTIKLYGYGRSRSFRCLWALYEAEIEHEFVVVDFGSSDTNGTQSPEYLQINPQGKIPSLRHNDFNLTESAAIINYIDTLSERPFIPTEAQARASYDCLLYTSPSPRDRTRSRMPSSA